MITYLLRCSIVLALPFLFAACGENAGKSPMTRATSQPGPERALVRGLAGEPRTLDPHLADDEFSFPVIRDLYEGLTAETADGNIAGGIAADWRTDSSGRVYTFHLRSNARWSDGSTVNAHQFVDGLRHAVAPTTAAGSASALLDIVNAREILQGIKVPESLGITAIGMDTVRIELIRPSTVILQVLSQPICAPLRSPTDVSSSSTTRSSKQSLVSSGAYMFVRWVPGSYIELVRNPNYWNDKSARIKRIKYLFSGSESTELNQYLAGGIDITSTIPMPDFQRISAAIPAEVQRAPILGTLYIAFNNSHPPLSDKRVRAALSMALDRDHIAQLSIGVAPAFGFVANGILQYEQQSFTWSRLSKEQRLKEARSLYEDAGYSKSKPLHIRLFHNSNQGIRRLMAAISANWRDDLGVDVQLISSEFRVFLEERKDRTKWDAIQLGWYADYNDPASFLDIFESGNIQNDAGYRSSQYDALIDNARNTVGIQRISTLQAAEKLLLDDSPIAPVYFFTSRRLVKPYVGGAKISPLNRSYSRDMWWKRSPQ